MSDEVNSNGVPNTGQTLGQPETQEDLERVRQIILGPDPLRQRLQQAEVDRLREILFGAQIEEYQKQFSDIRREIERMSNDFGETRERLLELQKTMGRRVETLELDLRKLNDDLRRESERQRRQEALMQQIATQARQHEETLKALSDTIGDMRKTQITTEAEVRSAKTGIIDTRDQIEQRAQSLRREMRQTEDELRAELRRVADRLDYQKTDRKALASMLIEIAARLETGNSITGLLEGLNPPKD
jgi:chromosome segregation ATPase